jgi:hypothetical protein
MNGTSRYQRIYITQALNAHHVVRIPYEQNSRLVSQDFKVSQFVTSLSGTLHTQESKFRFNMHTGCG